MKMVSECKNFSDEELVVKTLTDQDFYCCLVERYEKSLKRYILRISNISQTESEDVLQNIFLKAYLNLNDFDKDLKFSSWLYRIAHNEVISNFRKRSARRLDELASLEDWQEISDLKSIESEFDFKITKDQLYRVLNLMEDRYREILVLKFLEERSYQEISDILERPMGTIATLINRAKKQFRDMANKNNVYFV